MSDLWRARRDLRAPPTPRRSPGNRPALDLSQLLRDLAVVGVLFLSGCPRPVLPPTPPPPPRPALYVDAFAAPGGDGSAARPLKVLPPLVPAGTDVSLASGLYRGPFVLGDDARLEGRGEVVLHAAAGEVVLSLGRGAVVGLSLQGGDAALAVTGPARLERLTLSGQRREVARVDGEVDAAALTVTGTVEGVDGLVVRGALRLEEARFTGGLRRAVRVLEGGRAALRQVSAEGPKTLAHAVRGRLELRDASARLGAGPAVFVAGGEAVIDGLTVHGHEYALQVAAGATVTAARLASTGALEAAVSAHQATLTLSDAQLTGSGSGGAVQGQGATLALRDVTVRDARHLGVLVRQGSAHLERCVVERVSADGEALGDALMVRDARVQVDGLRVADVAGSALFASALALVTVSRLDVDRAWRSALFVERGATVRAEVVLVRGGRGPAVLVPDAATVVLGHLSVATDEVPLYAECDAGARVTVRRLDSTQPQPPSRCVTR